MLMLDTYVIVVNIDFKRHVFSHVNGDRTVRQADNLSRKEGYHHGALREALIEAASRLISERGWEGFTLADACRLAGVSTAAPYRHFADRNALVDAVAARAFELLTERMLVARDSHPAGSMESIVSMGRAYVAFAADEPALFHLMWGRRLTDIPIEASEAVGRKCFGVLLESVDWFRKVENIDKPDTLTIAVPLWTMVHGTASLLLGRNFQAVAPSLDTDALIGTATGAYLRGVSGGTGSKD